MKIIYVNKGASPSLFQKYLKKYNNNLQQQGQKYNQLLMEGLAENGAEVISLSSRPINRAIDKRLFFKKETEKECGILYKYVSFINYPVFRHVAIFFNMF